MRSAIAAVPSIGRAAHVERGARDADATQDLYERYSGQIFGFCVNKLGSRDEAEDALQTTFLNAHRALQRGVTPEAELAWLFTIAHNVCLTRRRSTRRRGRVESPSDFAAVQDVMPAPTQSPDDLVRLTEALEHMPDSQRRAILLREWQGLSYHEISDELKLSQSAVETLIFRARRTLASNLESEPKLRPSTVSRMRKALDAGALLAMLKGLFEGGAAVKVAAVAVAASGTVLVATAPPAPVSKPAPQKQEVASVAKAAPAPAPVALDRTPSRQAVARETKPAVASRSARPVESAPVVEAAVAEQAAPEVTAPAAAAAQPEPQKPKATPPGQAKKHEPAAQANGTAGKEKAKKDKGKSASADPQQEPAPPPEQLVAPVDPHAASGGQGDEEEKDKRPKK